MDWLILLANALPLGVETKQDTLEFGVSVVVKDGKQGAEQCSLHSLVVGGRAPL